jgi:hypothetical protein
MVRGRSWVLLVLVACGPRVEAEDDASASEGTEIPESCDAEPYDEVCQQDYGELCETRTDEEACIDTESLPGGVGLSCAWIEPSVAVIERDACTLEPEVGRCVGLAYPGDIGCTLWIEEAGRTLVIVPEQCFLIGWNRCDLEESPACACF